MSYQPQSAWWTPLPIPDPIVEEDEDDLYAWHYGSDAGGMVAPFKKHPGKLIRELSLPYLLFCYTTCLNAHQFRAAFEIYHAGLENYLETDDNYLNFLVPFGKQYKGDRLGDCHDKPYFLFCQTRPRLTKKHPLFFRALQKRLDNPRKYGVWRDVGRLLDASQYADNLNLHDEDDECAPSHADFESEREAPPYTGVLAKTFAKAERLDARHQKRLVIFCGHGASAFYLQLLGGT
ncbi:hypothetical protein C8R43DRAFT_164903 [Mycena crocata]|nr:hypothetical protein C8R43DRAFT_164903 [Mycena crocata]